MNDSGNSASRLNPSQFEAISAFEKPGSYGWILKYGNDQIGVVEVNITDSNNEATSPIGLWTEYQIFDGSPSGIRNNNPEQFKLAAKQIEQDFFDSSATIKHLFE
ncbi:MAG: hypothetical protein Q4E50_07090 [Tissierellia bacterium]|nr:hypothetical protein [Tissierellia bacterium]